MNKLLTKIVGVSLGLALAAGVGVGVATSNRNFEKAEAATTYYMTPNGETSGSTSTSYVTSDTTFTSGGVSWTFRQWNPSSLQMKGNQASAGSEFCFYSGTFSGSITQVVITFKSYGTIVDSSKFMMKGSTSAFTAQQSSGGTAMTWNSSAKTLTWTANSSSSYRAIAFYQNGKAMSGNNFLAASNAISVTYETGGTTYYGVTYNANGATSGTVPTDSTAYTSGSTVTVKGNTGNLAKLGYTYGGWNTKNDGTGTNYAAGTGTFTITADTTLYAKWNVDTLDSLSISGSMSKTSYKGGDSWDPSGLVVTANYQSGATPDVTSEVTWSYYVGGVVQSTANVGDTAVVARATFGGKYADSASQTVTVTVGVTYDLSNNFSTYASGWKTSYESHTVSSTDVGASIGATMAFSITNKQTSGVGSAYPCIGAKTNSETECLTFTLTQTGKKITSVDIVFVTRYTDTFPSLYLHKGSGIATTALSSLTMSGTQASEHTLSVANLNDTIFTVGYNAHQTSSNGAVGIKSISIGLADQASFGTLDHISITGMPNVVYHVGETFDSTGFAVTAFDGADEASANFKDVTSSVTTDLDSPSPFTDSNVPGFDCEVSYTGDGGSDTTSFHVYVYALKEYELVTGEQTDWSGQYLIVGTNYNSDLVAMNGGLENPDVPNGYKTVTESSGTIQAGQELEWTIAKVTGGYSIQGKSGKYIGSLTAKSNGMLVSETAVVNTLSYSSEDNASVITGTNTYCLKIYNETSSSRFRYYSSGSVQLYKLVESAAVATYAHNFLTALQNNVCEADGSTNLTDLAQAWDTLASDYNSDLTNSEKEEFRLGVASESGDELEKCLALYDYIATKYNTQLGNDYNFMNRSITPASNNRITAINMDNTSVLTVIVIIAVLGFTTIGGYFLLRKKKEER